MPLTRQLAEQALRALEKAQVRADLYAVDNAIDALRQALAEPEQEPVAWIEHGLIEAPDGLVWERGEVGRYTPLYTAPTPRRPLRHVTYVCPVCAASLERQE